MKNSRKDTSGHVLRLGESQRKDGRYTYSYTDLEGKRHCVYAKNLADLRKKEKKIIHDKEEGLDPHAAERITLNKLYEKYMNQKYDLKESTKVNYIYTYNHFVRDSFGNRKIAKIRYTDVKQFYFDLIIKQGLKANSIENIHNQIHPALQMAVRDGYLRVNPSDGVLGEIKKSKYGYSKKRRALTIPQQKAFMKFIENSIEFRGWLPFMTVLLGTGCRIGEVLGLRWEDLDFENRIISINHTLLYRPNGNGESEWHISTPKTEAGNRTIPMLEEVFEAFAEEYDIQSAIGAKVVAIDGYTDFVFTTGKGMPIAPGSVNRAISSITDSYNEAEEKSAKEEHRTPILLPHFSAHNLRHTFCTRLCENETNLKVIQEIMGHADISTTMDIYAEATNEKKQEVLTKLENKIIIK